MRPKLSSIYTSPQKLLMPIMNMYSGNVGTLDSWLLNRWNPRQRTISISAGLAVWNLMYVLNIQHQTSDVKFSDG